MKCERVRKLGSAQRNRGITFTKTTIVVLPIPSSPLLAELTKDFANVWAELDPDKDYFIESFKLVHLLYNVNPPLGLKGLEHKVGRWSDDMVLTTGEKTKKKNDGGGHRERPGMPYQKSKSRRSLLTKKGKIHVIEYIRQVGIKRDENGMCFYLDVLNALSKQAFQSQKRYEEPNDEEDKRSESKRKLSLNVNTIVGSDDIEGTDLRVEQMDAVNGELMSGMNDELRKKMLEMSSTTMLCDLTAEYNAASLIQCRYRGKITRRIFYDRCMSEGKWTKRLARSIYFVERSDCLQASGGSLGELGKPF